MKVHQALCLHDRSISDGKNTLHLLRGREYTVSPLWADGTVTVFSSYWVAVPAAWFGGFVPELVPAPQAEGGSQ